MKKLMVIEYLKTIIINIELYASGYEHVNFGVYVIIHPKNSCRMIDLRIDCYTIYLVIYLFETNSSNIENLVYMCVYIIILFIFAN